ncbi:MAG: hypothetical protein DMF68_10915 [Acidobacteria bacterium]|nr:MAG: hypothetical protein DMF68_10915 [Acidobacteriota bacterium]
MKTIWRLSLLALIALLPLASVHAKGKSKTHKSKPAACHQGTPFRGCAACGTASDNKHRTLNVQKNRGVAVMNPKKITVQEIRDPANNTKFTPSKKVWVTGFVASIDPGGFQETCNCKRNDLRDVHINIVADASEANDQTKYVVVEFTPRWEKKFGFDDSDYKAMRQKVEDQIKGKWVKFSGWMLYDFIHANASQSTAPSNPVCPNDGKEHTGCNWRATPWEVHPVTAFEVVNGP